METDFTQTDIEKRKIILDEGFSNRANAMKIAKEIFGEGVPLSQTV